MNSNFTEINEEDFITISPVPVVDPDAQPNLKDESEIEDTNKELTQNSRLPSNLKDPKFYQQSLYVTLIDRYLNLQGLECVILSERDQRYEFGFVHVLTRERIVVLSGLHAGAFCIDEKMPGPHKIIIDCSEMDIPFTRCESMNPGWHIDDERFREAHNRGFYLLVDGILLEPCKDNKECDVCWKRVAPDMARYVYLSLDHAHLSLPFAGPNQLPALTEEKDETNILSDSVQTTDDEQLD